MKKPPRYTIELTYANGDVLIQHHRTPQFSAVVKKDAEGNYIAHCGNINIPETQLKQMAKWYFFSHIIK